MLMVQVCFYFDQILDDVEESPSENNGEDGDKSAIRRGENDSQFGAQSSWTLSIKPLRPNNDLSQTSHCNIKG